MNSKNFSLLNATRGATPRIPFARIAATVLGPSYELSVALLPPSEMRKLTVYKKPRRLRSKVGVPKPTLRSALRTENVGAKASGNTASNVLAFPLGFRHGEVILCPAQARAQAAEYGYAPRDFLAYLFIHGLLHLKGRRHGATMESEEQRFLKRFGFHQL